MSLEKAIGDLLDIYHSQLCHAYDTLPRTRTALTDW